MKKILTVLIMICSLAGYGQKVDEVPNNGIIYTNGGIGAGNNGSLFIPSGCGIPDIPANYKLIKKTSFLYFDSCGRIPYFYDVKNRLWLAVGGGSTSGIDSVTRKTAGCTDSIFSWKVGVRSFLTLIQHSNGLVPGTGLITKNNDSVFSITKAVFYINCVQYSTADTMIKIKPPSDTGRIDLFIAAIHGKDAYLQGTKGLSLTIPPYGADTAVALGFVYSSDTAVVLSGAPTDVNWSVIGTTLMQLTGASLGLKNGFLFDQESGAFSRMYAGGRIHIQSNATVGDKTTIGTVGGSTTNNTTELLIPVGDINGTTGLKTGLRITGRSLHTSGNQGMDLLTIRPDFQQSGTYTGITRGIILQQNLLLPRVSAYYGLDVESGVPLRFQWRPSGDRYLVVHPNGVVDTTSGTGEATPLTLTTTGTSGAATYTGGVLNIPNYATGEGGGAPTFQDVLINGSELTQDNSVNLGGHDLTLDNGKTITFNSVGTGSNQASLILRPGQGQASEFSKNSANGSATTTIADTTVALRSVDFSTSARHGITIQPHRIAINYGAVTDTANFQIVNPPLRSTTTRIWGVGANSELVSIPYPSGGGGSGVTAQQVSDSIAANKTFVKVNDPIQLNLSDTSLNLSSTFLESFDKLLTFPAIASGDTAVVIKTRDNKDSVKIVFAASGAGGVYTATVDLTSMDYNIPGPGVYEITGGEGVLIFPNPLTAPLGSEIKTFETGGVNITVSDTNKPYGDTGNPEVPFQILNANSSSIFTLINGTWRGGYYNNN